MSQAIAIKNTRNSQKYGYSIPTQNSQKYLFELFLTLKNGNQTFRKIEENRYTTLIKLEDDIDYQDIENYNINISVIPDKLNQVYSCNGKVNNSMGFFSNQDNNIYIEFNRLANGKATCTCRYVDYNDIKLSYSPPY
jgi:hypothetical protein